MQPMVDYKYGSPGNYVNLKTPSAKIEAMIQCVDPMPGTIKQLLYHPCEPNKETHITIQHVHNDRILPHSVTTPFLGNTQFKTYLFYSATLDTKFARQSYLNFLTVVVPAVKHKSGTFVCILLNIPTTLTGYAWISENVLLVRRPRIGFEFGAYSDAMSICGINDHTTMKHQFHIIAFDHRVWCGSEKTYLSFSKTRRTIFEQLISCFTDDTTKLCGLVFAKNDSLHTMIFALDHIGLQLAHKHNVFINHTSLSNQQFQSEHTLSRIIRDNGYKIKTLF